MNVSDLGEFGLIQRLAEVIGAPAPAALIVGIGEDAAAWRVGESVLLATTDTLVEGVHFRPEWAPWRDLGWKALAISVSDIAAMGGEPQFALVTLALPPQTEVGAIDELYVGLRECAQEYGVTVAGGDVVQAPQVMLTVALLGRAESAEGGEPLLLRRDGARAGHVIAVTGTLGDSAAGLRRLREGAPADDPLARAHLQPRPPLHTARQAARLGIPCGIDVSDGLLQDLGHVCRMSGLGADIRADAVPISHRLRAAYPQEALALACSGGEDYQLLLAGPLELFVPLVQPLISEEAIRLMQTDPRDLLERLAVSIIGVVTSGPPRVRLLDERGGEITLDTSGWDHLRG